MTTNSQADDFDVGKAIFDQLKDLPPERQQRVLRWVAEGLGISSAAPAAAAHAGAQAAGASPTLPPAFAPTPAPPGSGADIKSFIATKAPKSDVQFAAAVAYFYKFEAPPAARHDTIGSELLQEAARLAARKRLSNPRHTLKNAKAAGYLDGAARGEYSINSVGENLVAMTLPGGGNGGVSAPRKRSTRKSAAPRKSAGAKRPTAKSRRAK
jgi:hypothetical protein